MRSAATAPQAATSKATTSSTPRLASSGSRPPRHRVPNPDTATPDTANQDVKNKKLLLGILERLVCGVVGLWVCVGGIPRRVGSVAGGGESGGGQGVGASPAQQPGTELADDPPGRVDVSSSWCPPTQHAGPWTPTTSGPLSGIPSSASRSRRHPTQLGRRPRRPRPCIGVIWRRRRARVCPRRGRVPERERVRIQRPRTRRHHPQCEPG